MSDLLEGLEGLGLDKIKAEDLYKKGAMDKKKSVHSAKKKVELPKEEFYIFEKTYDCPNCGNKFKNKTVKNGKAKLIGTDIDLRSRHEGVDMTKYEVVVCPTCGYAALSRYFDYITERQSKLIQTKISNVFRGVKYKNSYFSYKEALERYKLALANAIVKQAKASEKAYICLRTAWLLRGMGENLSKRELNYETKLADIIKQENEYLKNALEGFKQARMEETYPMCGMDEITIDYIIAALATQIGELDLAAKMISDIIVSKVANSRMKERARELKDILVEKLEIEKNA